MYQIKDCIYPNINESHFISHCIKTGGHLINAHKVEMSCVSYLPENLKL